MAKSPYQNAERNHNMNTYNRSFEMVESSNNPPLLMSQNSILLWVGDQIYCTSGTKNNNNSWKIGDQLVVTSYSILLHFFYAQHVSDINTSIIRSLRLFYFITTLVVCWSFGLAGFGWYPCSRLKHKLWMIGVLMFETFWA